ncbi:MAG: hypothetical protein PHR28_13430 [candidate division Zixibacteria bacterium]|nr:hypothetical protein [candidate division Zixibacteria bacterium]
MICLVIVLCILGAGTATAGGNSTVDYSQLHFESKVNAAVKAFAPPEFESHCLDWPLTPDMVATQIAARYYRKNDQDTLDNELLVFYASYKTGYLRILRPGINQDNWVLVAQTDSIFGEAQPVIECVDIDCDGANEIVLEAIAGANSFCTFGIVKLADDGNLNILTRFHPDNVIRGRYVDIDSTNNVCPRVIKVLIDGPVKYHPDSVRTFQFDAAKQSYRLESVQALPKQER